MNDNYVYKVSTPMTPIQEDYIFGTEDLKKGEDTNDLAPIKQNTILSANSQRIKVISAEGASTFWTLWHEHFNHV